MLTKLLKLVLLLTLVPASSALADDKHLLDGTSMTFYYQTGRGVDMQIDNGIMSYEWISGPRKGHGNKDLPYQSRKIGHKTYIFSWLEESHPDFITLVFNFDTNVVYSSGLARFGSDKQFIVFDGGIIQSVKLVEKQ